ncbi:MAG: hypothetical protein AAF367_20785 [Pseudomonadota bacterium]
MFLSAFLSIIGLGLMVYLLFSLAVYALPIFVALTVGMHLYETEAGIMTAIIAGLFAGVFTLFFGQLAFAKIKSVPVKLAIGLIFAAPAGIAGYHAVKGLSEIGGAPDEWTLVFAWIGAVIVAGTAWVRIASLAGPPGEDDGNHQPIPQAGPYANDR